MTKNSDLSEVNSTNKISMECKNSDNFIKKKEKRAINRKIHLGIQKVPWSDRHGPSRKKVFRKRREETKKKKNLENVMHEIVGEEDVNDKPSIKPISMRELGSALTDEIHDNPFLVDLEAEMKKPTTEELINILEDEDVSLEQLCKRERNTMDSSLSNMKKWSPENKEPVKRCSPLTIYSNELNNEDVLATNCEKNVNYRNKINNMDEIPGKASSHSDVDAASTDGLSDKGTGNQSDPTMDTSENVDVKMERR